MEAPRRSVPTGGFLFAPRRSRIPKRIAIFVYKQSLCSVLLSGRGLYRTAKDAEFPRIP